MNAHAPGRIVEVNATAGAHPLHDSAASRRAEAAAQAARPEPPLMARAGLAVARLALALAPQARRIRVYAGPGNNGGDGLVAARLLHQAGQAVQVVLVADPLILPADAAAAWQSALGAGVPAVIGTATEARAAATDLVIDALLGLGARREPAGALAAAIAAINASAAQVLAVDLPSGLHPDTGVVLGRDAVRAHATLALLTLKPGCLTGAGRDHAGALWLADLGTAALPAASPTAWLNAAPAFAPRPQDSHKGRFGDVAVVGGAPGLVGAMWLAARAALAAGAGRVYACPLDPQAPLLDASRPELMGRRAWWQAAPEQLDSTTVVCGCGGGDAVRAALPSLLSRTSRLVLDADALNAIAVDSALQALLQARQARGARSLLTPHPLEAARLLGRSANAVQQDRLGAAQALAQRYGCAVLLKGSGSIIAAPGELPRINATGNAALATAGTGDVLAGWAAGLWAQRRDCGAAEVASAAAWSHGRAADLWPGHAAGHSLRAADLIEALAALR
ncbi:MAG: NAD(P)H-hydrate dehydratase [Burkholderiales bacterium]|nr:NAD(P)H-hydrate dehydratase [Burkholderiales bacterium]